MENPKNRTTSGSHKNLFTKKSMHFLPVYANPICHMYNQKSTRLYFVILALMNWLFWILFVIVIVGLLLASTGWWRYVLTGYLITRVTPYEQPGGGAAGHILFVGDSTGYGTGADTSEDSVAGRLGNAYTWYTITNNSVNGREIAGAMKVVSGLSDRDTYNLIVLQIGANDMIGGATAEETVGRMRELIDETRTHAESVVVITCGNLGAPSIFKGEEARQLTDTARTYDQLMNKLSNEYQNVSFVSLFDEPEDDPFIQNRKAYTSIDGLHPSSKGYAIWYQKAAAHFDQVLEKR